MNKAARVRIMGLMVQELYLTKHSLETFFDIFFFPLMNVILFGFITLFLAGSIHSSVAQYTILGVLLWEIVTINQYCVTVSTLWSVWSHNLTNIFVAPISVAEYMTAHILAGFIKTVVIFASFAVISNWIFHFSLLNLGVVNLVLFYVNLSLFAWATGLVLLGFIFRYGTKIQAISWGLVFIFQPLTAAFFPLNVLPSWLQVFAHIFPATYVFEAARSALSTPGIRWETHLAAGGLNIIYFVLAWWVFEKLFRRSRETGQFARNDS